MEGVSPTLKLLLICKQYLSSQRSLHQAITDFIENEEGEFSDQVEIWLYCYEQGHDFFAKEARLSLYRRELLLILEKGLGGMPILSVLQGLQTEIIEKSMEEIEDFTSKLPFKMMIPLLFFQFPAFMVLLIGPILKVFLEVS